MTGNAGENYFSVSSNFRASVKIYIPLRLIINSVSYSA